MYWRKHWVFMTERLLKVTDSFFVLIKRLRIPEWFFIAGASIGVGVLWFLLMYGRFSLYFTHVSWIYTTGRDPLQHQLGWEFFRIEPWRFPLGMIKNYGYPYGTTVTFMDSIPLFAFFFKLISPWLGENFQYFGVWELTSVIGQMVVGMLIVREFTKSNLIKVLGASLLVLAPPMIYRAFYHSSLSAQWIILLAILFVILEYRRKLHQWYWLVLFVVTMLIHLYFIPMIIPLWGVSLVFRYQRERRIKIFLVEPLKVIVLIGVLGFCTGVFSLRFNELSAYGLGQFSWNLNGFFNPFDTSKFLNSLPSIKTQQEGYSYLGLGVIILLPISIVLFTLKDSAKKNRKFFIPFFIISLAYILVALSNMAAVNKTILWDIKLPGSINDVFSLFRSTGRFIWPVYYFIVLFAILALIRNCKVVWTTILLVIIIFVQFLDLKPLYDSKRIDHIVEYGSSLKSDFWQIAGKTNKHIEIIPTEYYETLAIFAVRHQMTLSSGYFGRADVESMETLSQVVWRELLSGKSDPDTLYILSAPTMVSTAKSELVKSMYVCSIDNYDIVLAKDNPVIDSDFNFNEYCLVP